MLGQGLTLTIVGMVIVFLFLGILVLLMTIMSRIIGRISARREAKAAEAPVPEAREHEEAYEEEDLSAVAAALAMYVHSGGVLPSVSAAGKGDVAAALAAIAAGGGTVPKGNSREVAAAVAAVTSYKKTS